MDRPRTRGFRENTVTERRGKNWWGREGGGCISQPQNPTFKPTSIKNEFIAEPNKSNLLAGASRGIFGKAARKKHLSKRFIGRLSGSKNTTEG